MVHAITAKEALTLPGLIRKRIERTPNSRAYMTYDEAAEAWREITWKEVGAHIDRFRAALASLRLETGDRVAVLMPNGIDWVGFDMAALSLGLVVVPLYSHDSPANHAYVLKDSGARLALVDERKRWLDIAAQNGPACDLEHVWVADCGNEALPPPLRRTADILPASAAPIAKIIAKPDGLATLVYTSGTTARPKGVMLTHAAILWNAEGVTKFTAPTPDDIFLSFLPLAHAFERTVGYYMPILGGATVAYARSIETLRYDIATVRPTVLLAVPRLYERIYAAVLDRAAGSPLKQWLLSVTARLGWRRFEWQQGRQPKPTVLSLLVGRVLHRLIAKRILKAFGGRMRVAVSGGAALPHEVARFLIGMGLPLVEGYGLTEAAPVVTGVGLEDNLPGSVGRPLDGSQIRVSGEGELLVRSPGLMQGYWNNPIATTAAFDSEGYLKTGDLAEIRDGRVFIRGRLKEIIVLSTGENVNPDEIERAILRDPLLDQVCVLGDGKPFPVVVAVLNETRWFKLAHELQVDPKEPNAAIVKTTIKRRIARELQEFSKPSQVHEVHLVLEPWTIEAGQLTPTFKVKRRAIGQKYATAVAALFGPHPVFA